MSDVTFVIEQSRPSDGGTPTELLPLVYDELRRLASQRLSHEGAGQTLQPTALVHEAYLRLVGDAGETRWENRGHFFAAAAEAMRRILVENARRKISLKRGGELVRRKFDDAELLAPEPREDLIALDEALTQLAATDGPAAELVKLRYFGGLSIPEAAAALDISPRTADRLWAYARAWLHQRVVGGANSANL
ncbi:ECF-type sigma factor [Zavarzinella formosa]|uniref:ECF-type sigma factor n=1 Tax=Zavarzinella formosa TaxID=360055 RepID=UPI0003157871|nr:ECF-type sigma factor [Zavarzinella formosa]